MLPNAVLTHLKAGVRAACLPLPVFIEVCWHPAWVTAEEVEPPALQHELAENCAKRRALSRRK